MFFLLVIILVQRMKWTIVVKQSTITKSESLELKNEMLLMKSMNIENYDNVKIGVAKGVHKSNVEHLFFQAQTSHDLTNAFTYFQSCDDQ